MNLRNHGEGEPLAFYFGTAGTLAPFALFLSGVAFLGLSGAPDERGFWPILVASLILGMALSKDRTSYAEHVVRGMSQPLVLLMIMAWLLAGALSAVMGASGLIDALLWLSHQAGVSGGGFVGATFLICALVSTAIGTSLGTILLTAPLLYPASAFLCNDPTLVAAAILGGATFGDNVSPLSDTTIASASTQGADLGGVVRSRLRYALPAAAVALFLFCVLSDAVVVQGEDSKLPPLSAQGDPRALPLIGVPLLIVFLLLRKRHLLEGLLWGLLAAVLGSLAMGLISPSQILSLDKENFIARGLILDGMEKAVGVSIFTILLMGLVAGIEGAGLLDKLVEVAARGGRSKRRVEVWIFGVVSAAVLLTTHSVVAILTVGKFTRETGESVGIHPYRRANLLDLAVCTYPFLLPFFIPTVLISSMTRSGAEFGLPQVSPWEAGLLNYHSWALLAALLFAIGTGWGRRSVEPVR